MVLLISFMYVCSARYLWPTKKKKIMMKTNWPKNSIIGKIKQKVFLLVDAIFCPPMANYKKVHLEEEGFVVTENSVNSKSFVSKSDIFPTFFIPNAFTAGRIPNFGQDHEWQGPLGLRSLTIYSKIICIIRLQEKYNC